MRLADRVGQSDDLIFIYGTRSIKLNFESAISFSFPAMADDDGSSNAGIAIGVVALVLVLVLSAVVTGLCCLWYRAKKKLAYLGRLLQLRVYCLYF